MGLLPSFDLGFDVKATVMEFITVLRSMEAKLDTLVDIERDKVTQARLAKATAARQAAESAPCLQCEVIGRLRCNVHGPDALFAEHETNERGDVTLCPISARTGETRDHHVRLDGTVVGCHPTDDDKLAPR